MVCGEACRSVRRCAAYAASTSSVLVGMQTRWYQPTLGGTTPFAFIVRQARIAGCMPSSTRAATCGSSRSAACPAVKVLRHAGRQPGDASDSAVEDSDHRVERLHALACAYADATDSVAVLVPASVL